MYKTIITTFLLVNLIPPNYICAGESQSKVNIKFKSQNPRHNRVPFQNPVDEDSNIDAYVDNGNLTIIFEESEGMATLKIEDLTDGSISTMQFHTSAPLVIPIGDPSAPLVFTITTDASNEYQAWL
ncbi:MAG TPA: hypothetical protein DDY12_00710 [Porphyromonadaceae bacterium]|mgnify:CR=1 FL=1|nr:hypothetical protein [Porphyromonadaceae bacterium]